MLLCFKGGNMISSSSNNKTTSKGIPKWMIVAIVILVLFVVGGSFVSNMIARKASEKIAEGLIKAGTKGNVEVDTSQGTVRLKNEESTIEVGTAKWPSDLPENIPAFPGGKIIAATKVGGSSPVWTMSVSEVNKNQVDSYQEQLLSSGWTADSKVDFLVNMVQLTKGNYRVSLAFDPSSNGVQISVSEK